MIKRILKHSFSLLNTDHVKLGAKWNYKNVISPYHRIYYIDDGEGEIADISKKLKLEAGFLYIIPSFTLCNLLCHDYLSQYFVQFFEESSDGISLFADNRSIFKVQAQEIDIINFKRLVAINPGRGINRSDNPQFYEKNIYYKEYQELNNQQDMSAFLETQGLLFQLVSRFTTHQVFKQKEIRYIPVKILETISFIITNLQMPLTVRFLADRVNQNPEYFSRLFQQSTGSRPSVYVNDKRIERAQYLMVTSQLSLSQIAEATGFETSSHFSRTFKRIVGLSPLLYRKQFYSAT